MDRRDFLLITTKGSKQVLDLSCEGLYMRYVDAQSAVGRLEDVGRADEEFPGEQFLGEQFSGEQFPGEYFPGEQFADERFADERFADDQLPGAYLSDERLRDVDLQSWDGEPPTEIDVPTLSELFEELDRELSGVDILRVHDRQWLADGDFRAEVEERIEAFRSRGGRVEFRDSRSDRSAAGPKTASGGNLAVAICLATAAALGASGSLAAQGVSDEALKTRVEVALAAASDVPADSITVEVSEGVVTLVGSVVCDDCGGSRTPGGTGTVQQSLGAVVRAVPGVTSVEFRLEYESPAPPGGARR